MGEIPYIMMFGPLLVIGDTILERSRSELLTEAAIIQGRLILKHY